MRRSTLTGLLFLRVAPTVLAAILLVGGLAYKSATRQINHVYDAQLISSANMLWLVVGDEMHAGQGFRQLGKIDLSLSNQRTLNRFASDYADSRMFRVFKGKKLAMVTDQKLGSQVPRRPPGFSDITYTDEHWRIYNLPIEKSDIAIEAAEKVELRQSLVRNILLDLSIPLLALIPLVAALIWFGIRAGLKTLRGLIDAIQLRSPENLSHLELGTVPPDLRPLGVSINQLLARLETSFTAERRFSDHAAHHLRTPLAALKLQLQLLATARNAAERKTLLNKLVASVDRAAHLVGQLLTSARVGHQPLQREKLSLTGLVQTLLHELEPLAQAKSIALLHTPAPEISIVGDTALLRLLIGNVLENAVKYTPNGGSVTATLSEVHAQAVLRIADTGAGIPEAERAQVFSRFYRVGTPEQAGSGLGLAIVAEIITRLGGTITLNDNPAGKGLQVEITLPTGL